MKRFAIILFALVISAVLHANEAPKAEKSQPAAKASIVSGKITDKTSGEELVGVAIKLVGIENVVYSDFEGNFSFVDLLPGNYKLQVELISYQEIETASIVVSLNEVHELNINLEQKK
jgi:hypothetical protein